MPTHSQRFSVVYNDLEFLKDWGHVVRLLAEFLPGAEGGDPRLVELARILSRDAEEKLGRAAQTPEILSLRLRFGLTTRQQRLMVTLLLAGACTKSVLTNLVARLEADPPEPGVLERELTQLMDMELVGQVIAKDAIPENLCPIKDLQKFVPLTLELPPLPPLNALVEQLEKQIPQQSQPIKGVGWQSAKLSKWSGPAPTHAPVHLTIGNLREPAVHLSDVILSPAVRQEVAAALVLLKPESQAFLNNPALSNLFYRRKYTSLLLEGPPGTGKTMLGEAIAMQLSRPVLMVRWEQVIGVNIGEAEQNVGAMFDEATANGAVLLLDEADSLLARSGGVMQYADRMHKSMVNVFLTRMEDHEGVIVLTTNVSNQLDVPLARRLTAHIRLDMPGEPERLELWRRYLPEGISWDRTPDIHQMAKRYSMSGSRIKGAIIRTIRSRLLRAYGDEAVAIPDSPLPESLELSHQDLEANAAAEARDGVRDLNTGIGAAENEPGNLRQPQVTIDQVVLPPAHRRALEDFLATLSPGARDLFESPEFRSLFQTMQSQVILLDGPPGTGKTMTAEAIAHHVGKPLLTARVEKILSTWVGQSEKALEALFCESEARGAVLLIDEADGLLGARTPGVQYTDRLHDNLVNLFLTRLERHREPVVLATNRGEVLDPALISRIGLRLTYAFPDAGTRERILARLLPAGVTCGTSLNLAHLAHRFALDGRQLKHAMLTALRSMVRTDARSRTLELEHLEGALMAEGSPAAGNIAMGFRI